MANVGSHRLLLVLLSGAALSCATTGNTYSDARPFERSNAPISQTIDVAGNANGLGLKRVDGKKTDASPPQDAQTPVVTGNGPAPEK